MAKPVLFAGTRPYGRAENISSLYDAYQGEKKYIQVIGNNDHPLIHSGDYDVMVIDDIPSSSPGTCIMIWHGIQGGKEIGYYQPNSYVTEERISKIDYIISASVDSIPMWAKSFRFPADRILPMGMPRTDQYIGKKKGDGGTILAGKRAYLYAPTFRWSPEPSLIPPNFYKLDKLLHDDEILAVKAHMVGEKILDGNFKHIIEIPQNEPSAPYLYDADVVITDYSSIIFDGYLLGKPAVLFDKNPGYLSVRGMYMNYPDDYSNYFTTDEKELLDMCREREHMSITEQQCMKKVARECNGSSCKRICWLITKLNGGKGKNG